MEVLKHVRTCLNMFVESVCVESINILHIKRCVQCILSLDLPVAKPLLQAGVKENAQQVIFTGADKGACGFFGEVALDGTNM